MDGCLSICGNRKYKSAVKDLDKFMQEHDLISEPEEAYNLRGDAAKSVCKKL